MYARRVNLKLKPNMATELPQVIENEVIPMLRKQKGFVDEMLFISTDKTNALAISLWENKETAQAYHSATFPAVSKLVTKFVDGTPQVETYDVASSTCHKNAAAAAV